MTRRPFLALTFFLILIWGCEEVVELDLPFEEQLVVESDIAPGRRVTTTVAFASSILSTTPVTYVEDAAVFLKRVDDDEPYHQMTFMPSVSAANGQQARHSYYVLDEDLLAIEEGNTYELRVNAPGFDQIITTTRIPAKTTLDDLSFVSFTKSSDERRENIYNIKANIRFQHTDLDNFYHLMFFFTYPVTAWEINGQTMTVDTTQVPKVEDLEIAAGYVQDFQNGVLLDGADLDTGLVNLPIHLSVYYDADEEHPVNPALGIELRNTSEAYFKYRLAISQQQQQQDSIVNQPIIIPSNIGNGSGSFGGYIFDEGVIPLGN